MHQTTDDIGGPAPSRESGVSRGAILDRAHWLYIKNRYGMSLRETQVAILACRDFSNEGIAQALKIKQTTAKTHLRSIYQKTGISDKFSLLLRFLNDIENAPVGGGAPPIDIVEVRPPPSPTSRGVTKLR
jgi:DNA-binding CsgD family transcriptional regulator